MPVLKLALRLLAHGRPAKQRDAILQAVDSPAALTGVKQQLVALNGGKALDGTNLVKLLQLLLANAPQIVAFIMSLVKPATP